MSVCFAARPAVSSTASVYLLCVETQFGIDNWCLSHPPPQPAAPGPLCVIATAIAPQIKRRIRITKVGKKQEVASQVAELSNVGFYRKSIVKRLTDKLVFWKIMSHGLIYLFFLLGNQSGPGPLAAN